MTQNPTPNPATDSFDDVELKAEMERKEASYPKKEDGSVDIDALTPEERADYWKDRHDASTRGFHSYKNKTDAEKRELAEKLEKLEQSPNPTPTKTEIESAANNADTLADFEKQIPNFELLDDDTQANLRAIFGAMNSQLDRRLNSDPGVVYGRQVVNEQKWDRAFEAIAPAFGQDLIAAKADFKSKYFQKDNVPDNIQEILTTLAKSYLYDTAAERGAQQARELDERIDPERGQGGPKIPTPSMSIDDWERLRLNNPKEFARRSKEFNEAMSTGKLAE